MNKIEAGQKYRVTKDFSYDVFPLKYFAKKNEILIFTGKNLGYARFYGENPVRLVTMIKKEAFEFLEEIK